MSKVFLTQILSAAKRRDPDRCATVFNGARAADRLKDMIVSGGENVFSAEVENAICRHPAAASCAVIGIPDARWGESVHAVVVVKPGHADLSADEIKSHCQALIAGYKCPGSVEFHEPLPLSGAGKVLKARLRAPYWRDAQRNVG